MNIYSDVKDFLDKAIPIVEYGKVIIEVKMVDGKPMQVNGVIHETLKRGKDTKDGKEN